MDGKSYQILSAAADGQVSVWDVRFEEKGMGMCSWLAACVYVL
jgi:hypothetical protein